MNDEWQEQQKGLSSWGCVGLIVATVLIPALIGLGVSLLNVLAGVIVGFVCFGIALFLAYKFADSRGEFESQTPEDDPWW